jgi:SHS2 domain-containing protein
MYKDFEQLPHTADIKIRVYGESLSILFCNALIGMFQSIGPQAPGCIKENQRLICSKLEIERAVTITSHDVEALLVDFLSEALYLSDVNNEAYLDAKVQEISSTQIKATIYGIKITGFEVVEIKAVTYHDLKVEQIDGVWQADIVFDI